jgi:hypothetical protein
MWDTPQVLPGPVAAFAAMGGKPPLPDLTGQRRPDETV